MAKASAKGSKLARLPDNAKVSKRPLLRLPLSAPRSTGPKIIYIGTKTPFLSAVKRCEKLLRLSEEREVQSARTLASDPKQRLKRKRGHNSDEILEVAETIAAKRRKGDADGEKVILKGSGKAIGKVLELGVWFQQRSEMYGVEVRTGTATGIDDVEYAEVQEKKDEDEDEEGAGGETVGGAQSDAMEMTSPDGLAQIEVVDRRGKGEEDAKVVEVLEESRIRNVSVVEVWVRLR